MMSSAAPMTISLEEHVARAIIGAVGDPREGGLRAARAAIAAVREREGDHARALLRKCYPFILRASEASEDDDILNLPEKILKEINS